MFPARMLQLRLTRGKLVGQQWFCAGGDTGQRLETGLVFTTGGEGALLASAGRGQGRCKRRTASMTKDYLVLNINSTELEKPCSAEIRNFLYLDPEFWCLEKGVAVTVQRTAPWSCVAIL